MLFSINSLCLCKIQRCLMFKLGTDIVIRQKLSTRDLSTTLLVTGLVIVYFLPTEFLFNTSSTLCIHKNLFLFNCPGCGMTRALYSLLHLDFKTALQYNPGVFILFPLLMTEIILGLSFNNQLFKLKKNLYYLLCISLLIIYTYRIFNQ